MEAVEQAIELTIETERYKWPIYSADYGIELTELIGKRREYIQGDIERRLSDALAEDDRIIGTRDFSVVFRGERANIRIIAETKYGKILIERSVPIG